MEKNEVESYTKAGIIAYAALQKGLKMIKPGASVKKILDETEEYISSQGAETAFPAQIAINNTAAHYCPAEDDVTIKEGDIVKLDVGVHVDGYIADTARTVNLGDKDDLVKASEDALRQALKKTFPGTTLGEIGRTIQEVITSYGFSPIRNLSGHALARYEVHAKPTIPNFDTGDETQLMEGQVIAIEPFASTGAGIVYESSNPTIFTLVKEKPARSPFTRQALQEIKKYKGLPFTARWLHKKLGVGKTGFALRELKANGSIQEHPPLLDKAKGIVSQAEHSIILMDKPIIYTKGDTD